MKVKVENPTGDSISIMGRTKIYIPAHSTGDACTILNLPDNEGSQKILARLKQEYPAIVVTAHTDVDDAAESDEAYKAFAASVSKVKSNKVYITGENDPIIVEGVNTSDKNAVLRKAFEQTLDAATAAPSSEGV